MSSDLPRLILSVDDFGTGEIQNLLRRARRLAAGEPPEPRSRGCAVGLVFFAPSLRTRAGFALAAHRLGWTAIHVDERRWDPGMSEAETLEDTVRTISGMVDAVVIRAPVPLDRDTLAAAAAAPLVNAGDGGPSAEHPSQALVDVLAIEEERGSVADLTIAICGDLTMRAVRSLLRLFARFPPKRVVLIGPARRTELGFGLPAALAERIERRDALAVNDADVLYVAGMPFGTTPDRLTQQERAPFIVDTDVLRLLPPTSVVLCPLPVIDEITVEARRDRRVRMFAQSDRAVWVRVALLEALLPPARVS